MQWLGAVQSQVFDAALWGVAQRTRAADATAVLTAFDEGRIVRTHVLRPTWHLVRPADLRWMQTLTAPRVRKLLAPYDRKLEIDRALLDRAARVYERELRDGRYRTRAELADALAADGVEARGQRLAHLVMHAEIDALVCSGPMRGTQQTYALVDERIAPTPPCSREEALGDLARRYFASHGPATPHDFAWWSGLTVADARAALVLLDGEVEQATVSGKLYAWIGEVPSGPRLRSVVHLLPCYDEHIVAYRDHQPSLHPEAPEALRGWGTGATTHSVVRDGLVVGGWRRTLRAREVVVEPTLLVPLTASEHAALRSAADAFGRHLGRAAVLKVPDADASGILDDRAAKE